MATPNIEISTTQNVVITYELAGLMERILAWLVDFLIMSVGMLLLWWIIKSLFLVTSDELLAVILLLPFIFYSLLWEIFNNGRSPGKMVLGLQVMKINGMSAGPMEYFSRWVVRWADIYGTSGALGGMLILTGKHNQRLGDIMANTAVVRKSNRLRVTFPDLMRLHGGTPPEIIYPEAARLNEEQVLLIRETLDRASELKNPSHDIALRTLSEELIAWCDIQPQAKHKHPKALLEQIIRDYIQLTR